EDLTGASLRPAAPQTAQPVGDLWYLVYRDDDSETHTVKGSTDAIRRALKDGLLGDASNIRASRSKQGQFLHLDSYPEFRDMLVEPAPVPPKDGPPSQLMKQTPSARKTPINPPPVRPDPEAVDYTPTPVPTRTPTYDPTQDDRPVSESTTRPLIPV